MSVNLTTPLTPGNARQPIDVRWKTIQDAINALNTPIVRTIFASGSAYTTDWVLLVDATAAAVSVSIPLAANGTRPIAVKKIDSSGNAVTLYPAGSDKLEGAATITLAAQYDTVTLCPDLRAGWWKV